MCSNCKEIQAYSSSRRFRKRFEKRFYTTYINEKWVGDITYIHTSRDGWCYLASVLDLHSKKIIGYAFGKRMTNDLVVKALKNAYYSQNPDKNKQYNIS